MKQSIPVTKFICWSTITLFESNHIYIYQDLPTRNRLFWKKQHEASAATLQQQSCFTQQSTDDVLVARHVSFDKVEDPFWLSHFPVWFCIRYPVHC